MRKYLFILFVLTFVSCSDENEFGSAQEIENVSECEVPDGVKRALMSQKTFNFPEGNYGIITNADELEDVCQGEITLPQMGFFTKYDIVVGVVRTNDTGYSIKEVKLKDIGKSYQLDVYLNKHDYAFCAFSWFLYWEVFPKLENKPMTVRLFLANGEPFTIPQEKYDGDSEIYR